MSEAKVCGGLVRALRRDMEGAVVIRHTDELIAGIPDISVTWNGSTTWLEVKFVNPKIIDRGIQRLMMKRLGLHGRAFYVIYDNRDTCVYITGPESLENYRESVWAAPGFSHKYVSMLIRDMHLGVPV